MHDQARQGALPQRGDSNRRAGRPCNIERRVLDLALSVPKELGGPGGTGTNPEQLFAAGYAACFLGAVKFVARARKIAIPDDASVTAAVGIGAVAVGYGLEVDLKISLPGMDRATAEELVTGAHERCPYSNATRGNIDVRLTVV